MEPGLSLSLSRFNGQSRLLLRALLSGVSGVHRAVSILHRQQRARPGTSLDPFIHTLCRDEVTCGAGGAQPLQVVPLVCLFPPLFKHNLLSFIHLVFPTLPHTSVLQLITCLRQGPEPSPWVSALLKQLERSLGVNVEEPLCSPQCSQRLEALSQRLAGSAEPGGWAKCFSGQSAEPGSQGALVQRTQRKRKSCFVTQDSEDEETGQQKKRMKMDVGGSQSLDAEEQSGKEETSGKQESDSPGPNPAAEDLQPVAEPVCGVLPQHIKDSVLEIVTLLESEAEWDESSLDVFKVLHDCDAGQVEVLCSMLRLPDLPEHTLPQLCSGVLAPPGDLSYSTATALIKSLLLERMLSLSEPASRCLVTAVTMLCSRYPRPMCHAVIGPVLEKNNLGNPQAELLNRLIEGFLDSHYRLLVLQMTFKITWSEAVLSVIHSVLDSKPDFSEELFTQFTEQLVIQAPQLTKSMKFTKMLLTVLTKCSSSVTAAHKHSLQGCLMLNETFLKKSLQAALKKILHS